MGSSENLGKVLRLGGDDVIVVLVVVEDSNMDCGVHEFTFATPR